MEMDYDCLQLESMSTLKSPNAHAFHAALMNHIELMEHSMINFKSALKYVSKLGSLDPDLALDALEHLIQGIGSLPRDERWLEQTFVVLIRMLTSDSWTSLGFLKVLENTTDILSGILSQSLSNEASDASLVIIWKKAESLSQQGNFNDALAWYRFTQNAIFHRATETNKMKILKRLVFCGVQLDDCDQVKRAWMLLPEQERDPHITYLAYQVLLKDSDSSLAASLLQSLTRLGEEGHVYTSAAIAAASLSQKRRQALQSIVYIFKNLPLGGNENMQPDFNLYRIAIQLIVQEIRETNGLELHEQLCGLLSRAVNSFQRQDCFDLNDLDWFSRCSYLSALELFDKLHEGQVLVLIETSLKLASIYPQSIGSDVKLDLLQRRLSSHYIHVLISTSMARKQTGSANKQSYSQVEKHFQEVQKIMPESRRSGKELLSDEQYRHMLLFKTEATSYLKQWGR